MILHCLHGVRQVVAGLWLLGLAGTLQAGWTAQSYVATELYDIAYRPVLDGGGNVIEGEFVAVGRQDPDAGVILTRQLEDDGVQWMPRSALASWSLYGVAASMPGSPEVWVAVGQHGSIMRSTNRTAWIPVGSPTVRTLYGVAAGLDDADGTLFVAVGELGTLLTSTDGQTWTERSVPTTSDLRAVSAWGNDWAAVGDDGTLLRSSDGVNWTLATPPTTEDLHAVLIIPGVLYVGGERGFLACQIDALGDTGLVPVNWPTDAAVSEVTIHDLALHPVPPDGGDPYSLVFGVGSDGFLAYGSTTDRAWSVLDPIGSVDLFAVGTEGFGGGNFGDLAIAGDRMTDTLFAPVERALLLDFALGVSGGGGDPGILAPRVGARSGEPRSDFGDVLVREPFSEGFAAIYAFEEQLFFGGFRGMSFFSPSGLQAFFAAMNTGGADTPFVTDLALARPPTRGLEIVMISDSSLVGGSSSPEAYHYDGLALTPFSPPDFLEYAVATNGDGWILAGAMRGPAPPGGGVGPLIPGIAYTEFPWDPTSWVQVAASPITLDPGDTLTSGYLYDVHYHDGVWALVGIFTSEETTGEQAYVVTGTDADLAAVWDPALVEFFGPPFTEVSWTGKARPTGRLVAVTHGEVGGNARWAAVGLESLGAWGPPGGTWTEASLPPGRRYTNVAWGDGAYKAVGFEGTTWNFSDPGFVAHSADAAGWSIEVDGLPEVLWGLAYGPFGWVATGLFGTLATNFDAPADPVALTTTYDVAAPSATLDWTDAADNEAGYLVERREGSGPWRAMALLAPDTETWTDTTVSAEVSYQYRVRAWREPQLPTF